MRHYSASEYGAYPQNWSITQDPTGRIYVGNYDGIVTFDGLNWDLVTTPTNTTVRSLAARKDGRVYAGLQGDFGYLTTDSLGRKTYMSLADSLREDLRDFRDVWGVHVMDEYVFFQSYARLFRWDGETFTTWESDSGFDTSFLIDDTLYVREAGVGLQRLDGDELTLVAAGASFAETRISILEEWAEGELLIGTFRDGLYTYRNGHLQRFRTDADEYLGRHRLYHGTTVAGAYVALGLLDGGGMMLLDREGGILEHFTERSGLRDAWVNHVFRDAQGGLWLALNNRGLVRIDLLSGATRFDVANGLDGVVTDVVRHDGDLYVAASTGLLRLNEPDFEDGRASFDRVDGVYVATAVHPVADQLLVTTHDGLHVLEGGRVRQIAEGDYFRITRSDVHPGRYYVGSSDGVARLDRDGTEWNVDERFLSLGEEVRRLRESGDGRIWFVTRSNRVYRFDPETDDASPEEITTSDMVVDGNTQLIDVDGHILLVNDARIVHLGGGTDQESEVLDALMSTPGRPEDSLLAVHTGLDGDVWHFYPGGAAITSCQSQCTTRRPEALKHMDWAEPINLYVDDSGVTWISSAGTIFRYDPDAAVEKKYDAVFPAQVNRVLAIEASRELFGGVRELSSNPAEPIFEALPFAQNALRFEFTLPSYNDPEQNMYQYWLEGREEGWSAWTHDYARNYTNLREGTYRFHVRGRNAQGYVSEASVYTFTILPPWYRTVWAYGAYAVLLLGLGVFGLRYRRMALENRRAKKQKEELDRERRVNERLHDLNKRLEQANETLRQADRLKDEFLANTSHELRTPLTGILGCSAILREEVDADHREFVDMIDENGQRLLNTLDSLLDLARLRAGLMEFDFREIDLAAKVEDVVQTYDELADAKGIDLTVHASGDVKGWYDDHCIDCVINHLVGNAVKFTNEGHVDVRIEREHHEERDMVRLEVADTGVGIDAAFMPFLFDEFKQESTGLTRSHEGNGLGLAVTARVVDLLGGDIDVDSTKHVGTTLTVRFPLETEHPQYAGHGDGVPAQDVSIDVAEPNSEGAV